MSATAVSIPDALADRARQQPDDLAYTFVDYDFDPAGVTEHLTWSELHERVGVVADKLANIGRPGDRAVILAPQSLDYIVAFLGAIQAGLIAVPLSMPMFRRHDERIAGVMEDATPVAVLTTSDVIEDIRRYGTATNRQAPKFVEVDALDFDIPAGPTPVALPKAGYIQYTSGSTRRPAGVVVTHRNIFENMEQIVPDYFEAYDAPPPDLTIVTWLPLYHDMGLLTGVFLGMRLGRTTVLMSPVAFMQKPARWIRHLAAYPHTFTAAPNFAYDLAVKRTTDDELTVLDLSGVVVMINGAERVHGATVRRFNERFGPLGLPESAMRPSYGLAEATVYITSSAGGQAPTSVWFDYEKLAIGHAERCADGSGSEHIGLGVPRSTTVRIVDPQTYTENPAATIGEVWLHGPQVAGGYWHNPQLTAQHFAGHLAHPSAGTPKGPWLRTGDLGVMFDDELFLVGRTKDLLIIDGRNHYPDDIEATVQELTGGRVAAVSVPDGVGEKLVVIAELRSQMDPSQLGALKQQLRAVLSQKHNVHLADAVLVARGALPLTTSGKVRRVTSAQMYQDGEFQRSDVS
ncbi:fatty-acid--AMP ligase [Mycobacterium sp. ITM-2016-00317]|uniref:fatty-acid--AMP ligase n=1 Tax=Mycobacterium sp. ITM-2016-00317 TaxID=2099694 RepID=UPI00287F4720|nr:fatty-acid--AMP ligase [Mycobacterium sp. ITM-2016-00317]WNG88544.1 fatty-acid--AMP ligase [Mycobacterium sp. ITM-2016-00317]